MNFQGSLWKLGDNIDTDMIIAGEHLGTMDPALLRPHCLQGAYPGWATRVQPGDILLAGKNFGCGSSREHAPIAIKACGVDCVIAKSFGAIFYRNAINVGLCLIEAPDIDDSLEEGDTLTVDCLRNTVYSASKDKSWTVIPPEGIVAEILKKGGLMGYIQAETRKQQ